MNNESFGWQSVQQLINLQKFENQKIGIFLRRLGGTGGLPCTEYTFCRKGMTTGLHGSLLSLLLRQARPGRALNQCLVILQMMHLGWAQKCSEPDTEVSFLKPWKNHGPTAPPNQSLIPHLVLKQMS